MAWFWQRKRHIPEEQIGELLRRLCEMYLRRSIDPQELVHKVVQEVAEKMKEEDLHRTPIR